MIDYDKLDKLMELPVSEEMIGAYLEGNLHGAELDDIAKQVSSNIQLTELFHDVSEDKIDALESVNHPWDIYKGDFGFWELGLPPAITEDEVDIWQNNDNNLVENNMADMFRSQMHVYGEAGENVRDPIFIQQPDDHSCALRSQQIVLRDFGIDIPFDQLEQIALDNGVYTNEGTYTYDIGKVLELAGVGMHQVTGSTMYNLMNELTQGHRVIVSVDAYELWNNDTAYGRLKNWFDDVFSNQGGNHALIVAGVEVNPNDINDIKVVLTDPGAGHLRIEYPAEQFMDAWKDSNCFMVATEEPAPYQYDASTGMEVPSNFAVQQHLNQFVADNSYQLSPDLINIPADYQPAFTEHLEMVGNMSYDSFKEELGKLESTSIDDSSDDGDTLFSHNKTSSSSGCSSQLADDNEDTDYDDYVNEEEDDGDYNEDYGDFEEISDSF